MRSALVSQNGVRAGILEELDNGHYRFTYENDFEGEPVSLTMPRSKHIYEFEKFPPLFEGLLPEGIQLDALLKKMKIDRNDLFGQLIAVGGDVVGSLTIEEIK